MKPPPLVLVFVLFWAGLAPVASAGSTKDLQERARAMLKDAEEMIMHGGMGDAKAIVHHCSEVAKHAEAILKALPPADEHGKKAAPHLRDAIRHCKRVAEMGDQVDPGASLNPATKARAAVRDAMPHISGMKESGT